MKQKVIILLSTYNGEKFLNEFLESLLKQNYSNWQIIARDDGSVDNTRNILNNFSLKNPDKIRIVNDDQHLGVMHSFSALCQHSGEYTMFADQDDIWLPDKITKTLSEMNQLETLHGKKTPILVHSSFQITDKSLKNSSSGAINQKRITLKNLLVQNCITGCTIMFNAALCNIASPIPDNAIMHDYWFGLVATSLGKVGFIDSTLMLYRQHENNSIGANPSIRKRISLASSLLSRTLAQSKALQDRINSNSLPSNVILDRFIELAKDPTILNKLLLVKEGYSRNKLLENAVMVII